MKNTSYIWRLIIAIVAFALQGCLKEEQAEPSLLYDTSTEKGKKEVIGEYILVSRSKELKLGYDILPKTSSPDGFRRVKSFADSAVLSINDTTLFTFEGIDRSYFIAQIENKHNTLYVLVDYKVHPNSSKGGFLRVNFYVLNESDDGLTRLAGNKDPNGQSNVRKIWTKAQLVSFYRYAIDNNLIRLIRRYDLYESTEQGLNTAISDYKKEFGEGAYTTLVNEAKRERKIIEARGRHQIGDDMDQCIGLDYDKRSGVMRVNSKCTAVSYTHLTLPTILLV